MSDRDYHPADIGNVHTNARFNQDLIVKSGCNQTLLNDKNLSTLQISYKIIYDRSKLKVSQLFLHA